ncbi:MAG: hypothetical protein P8I38_10815 [Arenicella sp.]|jgi:4-hydroxybenzoate polyprenyltransferase|nr:hypothetical protein [Arenicella sp.]HAU67770.1 hypothetical protein [Gammaproteobacteria bacterium]
MGASKILLILVVLISVVSAFMAIPELAAIAGIVGLIYGVIAVEDDRRVYFLVMAVALATGAGALGGIPVAGEYLTSMLTTLSAFASAGAIGVIGKGIADRLM